MTNITSIAFDALMTEVDRFDDCRRIELFAVADATRKHGGGRKQDMTIRTKLVQLLREMAPNDGGPIHQADVLAEAATREIASVHTLRSCMVECASEAGVQVIIQRGRRPGTAGAAGPRDETIVRERLFREAVEGLKESHPDGIGRDDFEAAMLAEKFKIVFIKAVGVQIAKEMGLTIHDRPRAVRKPDTFRLEVTRKALAAADAAGLRSRDAICTTVLRFWQAHGVECSYTPAAAYSVILQVRKMDAAPVEEVATVEEVAPF